MITAMCVCINPGTVVRILETPLTWSPAELLRSRVSKRPHLKEQTENNRGEHLMSTSGLHAHRNISMHAYTE